MPLLALNLSDKLFLSIKDLVEKGSYQSPESFIEIAAFNQLALERGATPMEIIDRGHRSIQQHESKPNGARSRAASATTVKVSRLQKRATNGVVAQTTIIEAEHLADEVIDRAFKRLLKRMRSEWSPAPCKASADHDAGDRIFGQVNRLFPMKVACRWLATLSAEEAKWPRFDSISDDLADDAATIGSLLELWDAEASRKRDEQLATGLPRRGNSSSRDRFLSQFVARSTRAGEIYPGAICQYELAKFVNSTITLTEPGLAFAQIDNPVLDAKDKRTPTALSEAETNFLVRQVQGWVPNERDDMRVVLAALESGKTTPSELTSAVMGALPSEWTESMASTHISGLVARLAELRLLRRQWQGRRVTYELGEKGNQFLKVKSTKEHAE